MSRKPKVTILYEDARGQRNEFGLHRLVISAVRDDDAITAPYHELAAALEHRCQKGVDQVLRTCREDLPDIARDGRKVAVVVDEDVIRDKLRLKPCATLPQVAQAIRALCAADMAPHIEVFVLSRNLESVLKAARDCVKEHRAEGPTDELFDRALCKDQLARDLVLSGVAKETHAKVRRCILHKISGLSDLVQWLGSVLSASR